MHYSQDCSQWLLSNNLDTNGLFSLKLLLTGSAWTVHCRERECWTTWHIHCLQVTPGVWGYDQHVWLDAGFHICAWDTGQGLDRLHRHQGIIVSPQSYLLQFNSFQNLLQTKFCRYQCQFTNPQLHNAIFHSDYCRCLGAMSLVGNEGGGEEYWLFQKQTLLFQK